MDKRDQSLLKNKVISKSSEDTSVVRIASCYVDKWKNEIKYQEPRILMRMDESEVEQYLAFMVKGVGGKLGSSAMELDAGSEDLFSRLRTSRLEDESIIRQTCEKIYENYVSEENFGILLAYGEFDLPDVNDNTPDEVYSYVIVMIQPCPLSKPGLVFDSGENLFIDRIKDHALGVPAHAFLYPSLDGIHTDIDHAFYCAKTAKLTKDIVDTVGALFNSSIPLPAEEQKEGFRKILQGGFSNAVPFSALQEIYEKFSELQVDAEYSGQDVTLTAEELTDMVVEACNLPEEGRSTAMEAAGEYKGCSFSINNIAPKTVCIETGQAVIKMDLGEISSIEKKQIDGREYYLIPADNSSVEGVFLRK